MTEYTGNIRKMRGSADKNGEVSYQLPVGEHLIAMNPLLGQPISLAFSSTIHCVHCHKKTKKSFNQGYCYPCLMKLAQCDSCIIKPELCHYEQGTCREPQWGEEHCLNDHFVYLANTGAAKVGITRHVTNGVSSRWIDQGATQALPIMRVKNRLLSGLVETQMKAHIADKTNWRTMLKGKPEQIDLLAIKDELLLNVSAAILDIQGQYGIQAIQPVDTAVLEIHFPVLAYPNKISSINLDKTPTFSGVLTGIKGQYWMLDNDRVINMRKYAGYEVTLHTV